MPENDNNMDIKTKQMLEKNRLARYCGTITCIALIFCTIRSLVLDGQNVLDSIRLIVAVIDIILFQVCYKSFGTEYRYKYVVTLSMVVLFILNIYNPTDTNMYIFMYTIILIVMIYGEAGTVRIGCFIANFCLVTSGIIELRKGNISGRELVTELVFSIIACTISVIVCKQQRRQTTEVLDTIKDHAEEIKETSDTIVNLAEQLNVKFEEANEVSTKLNESMDLTHTSVNEIVEGTKNTAEAIENQTNKTAIIQESIQTVGEEATNIDDVSSRVEESVNEGVSLINQLKSQAEEVAKINIETSTTTQALNDSIQDVQAITETILGISSQTNLLALNASIEAARAGEAGKGFAVVADEIRALSESTREATEEISRIIERLTNDAKSASSAMSKSAEYATKQNGLIAETGTKLDAIKEGTDELRHGVVQVKGSVDQVITANSEIMDNITNLSATSEEVAAAADTVGSVSDDAMEALKNMNETLEVINKIAREMEEMALK
ncbi:methyl-accepting chemotaxis protein [Pseudobutyrivibrio xylanivorans]|nr:methyl-accepting chemotaxis protein [Pseudobutyrivibrio xylanivorans]